MKEWIKFGKIVLTTILISMVLLILLSFLMYKRDIKNETIDLVILIIYGSSCLVGGILAGKLMQGRRFVNGAILGIGYFALLFIISIIFQSPGIYDFMNVVTVLGICVGCGMLGAVLQKKSYI